MPDGLSLHAGHVGWSRYRSWWVGAVVVHNYFAGNLVAVCQVGKHHVCRAPHSVTGVRIGNIIKGVVDLQIASFSHRAMFDCIPVDNAGI